MKASLIFSTVVSSSSTWPIEHCFQQCSKVHDLRCPGIVCRVPSSLQGHLNHGGGNGLGKLTSLLAPGAYIGLRARPFAAAVSARPPGARQLAQTVFPPPWLRWLCQAGRHPADDYLDTEIVNLEHC